MIGILVIQCTDLVPVARGVAPGTPITIRSSVPASEASGSAEERARRGVVVLVRPSTRINTLLSPS